jgi:glyoxylase I family protein
MFKRIDHVELIPTDYEKTISFYTDILGFEIKERQTLDMPPLKEIAYLTLGDTMMEFLNVENPEAASANPWRVGYVGIAIEVDNMDEAVAYLKDKGVDIAWGPMDIGGPIRAEIRDPDGLTIELRQW